MRKTWCRIDSASYTDRLRERIRALSRKSKSGCIEWTGASVGTGYGQVKVRNRNELAHRVVFTIEVGAIPTGMDVLHRCDNPRCVLVDHLFLGSHADNMADKTKKGRAHSKLTAHQAAAIKVEIAKGTSCNSIAVRLGLSPHTISDIKNGITWKHVSPHDARRNVQVPD